MDAPRFVALLVKLPPGGGQALAAAAGPSLRIAGLTFEIEPLFTTGLPAGTAGASAAAPGAPGAGFEWHVARLTSKAGGAHPWEIAHTALRGGLGLAGAGPATIEPDLEQQWITENPLAVGQPAAAAACVFEDQSGKFPRVPGRFAWHLEDGFSQLRDARNKARPGRRAPAIRIAHLDTGYADDHETRPRRLNLQLQENFLRGEPANDARDPAARGVGKAPGHGAGTLGILSGNRLQFSANGYQFDDDLGGAPDAEIVPFRVGNSVVQLYTSSVAQAISRAADLSAHDLTRVHVISMSMGGVASQAWADAVNKAYDAGIVFVAAAGNNFSAGFFAVPTRFIVYPARFRRVIAACGVMADGQPYYGLPLGTMQGNWGPSSKMATAMAAYTPNIPWAQLGCPKIVDMNGQGTSAATPQIAAAAALYLQKHASALFDQAKYPQAWMRVEAVRQALFSKADNSADGGSPERLGNGILRAAAALEVQPLPAALLRKAAQDQAAFSFLRTITGLGLAATDQRRAEMLALEATQLTQQWADPSQPNPFEEILPDPDLPGESIPEHRKREFIERLIDHPRASKSLRDHLKKAAGGAPVRPKIKPVAPERGEIQLAPAPFAAPKPPFRSLRGFAIDPDLSIQLKTASISEITFRVPWESLDPGPAGEYLEVIDADPASGCFYEPVDLDDPLLLAQNGFPPSEGTPQFHQQMVYAVASLTIRNFELALGRRALWRPGPSPDPDNARNDSVYVPRLRIHPHALRERNAYYSPLKIALLFGYFRAAGNEPDKLLPGGMIFTCLSHDIIAHETTHALLDGMHRSFLRPTNWDVHAFHEAFADIVAVFQHFTFREILRHEIASSRGDMRSQRTLLGELAGQFGRGAGLHGALRSFIGKEVKGVWTPHEPKPSEYETTQQPHDRGAILVAAVFDAFLSIYESRTADLVRLATGGTGVLKSGALHPDLVRRMADEAVKSAQHVLTMCVRALDYCPPVDITFGEFLRAIITADFDLVENDALNYRVAFIEAFRRRGIYPPGVRTLSVESLLWRGPDHDVRRPSSELQNGLGQLRRFADEKSYAESREETFHLERKMRREIHGWLKSHLDGSPHRNGDAAYLGLNPELKFEVRTARIALRVTPDGDMKPQALLGLLQETSLPMDPDDPQGAMMPFEGGCALVVDLQRGKIRYAIRKSLDSESNRVKRQRDFALAGMDSLRPTYYGARPFEEVEEPFAAMHRGFQETT
jgi:subtilisin family serine protease